MDQVLLRPRRAAPAFTDYWDNSKALRIGICIGQGWSPARIERELMDGTSAESIRSRLQKIGYRALSDQNEVSVVVPLTVQQRALIQARADQRGLSIGEYLRRLGVCGSVKFGTYDDVVPPEQWY